MPDQHTSNARPEASAAVAPQPGAEKEGAPKAGADRAGAQKAGASFWNRLFHRRSDHEGEGEKGVGRGAADAARARGAGRRVGDGDFPTIVRKISKREETVVKISEGLNELSQLMRCVGDQLDRTNAERSDVREAVAPLREFLAAYPERAERHSRALEAIRDEVATHRRSSEALAERLAELPAVGKEQVTLLQGVLRNAEEQSRKLTEVLSTVEAASARNLDALQDLRDVHREAIEVMTRTQQDTYKEFDRRNDRQQRDLVSMIGRTNRHHAVLMVVFLLVTLCAVSVAALLTKPGSGAPLTADNAKPEVVQPLENP